MKRYSCLLLLVSLLYACKNDSDSSYHLSPREMGSLLMDIHMAEAYSSIVKKDSADLWTIKNYDSLSVYYKDVFTHHNITREQFIQTMTWYREHPADLDSVYEKMIPEMTKLEMKNNQKKTDTMKKADTVKPAVIQHYHR